MKAESVSWMSPAVPCRSTAITGRAGRYKSIDNGVNADNRASNDDNPEQAFGQARLRTVLRDAMSELSPDHRTVIELSGNVYLPRMWEQIEPSMRSLHVVSDPNFIGDWHEVAETHRGLLSALDGGDPETAARLFRAHSDGHALVGGQLATS